jgi:hypothetical protein
MTRQLLCAVGTAALRHINKFFRITNELALVLASRVSAVQEFQR